MSDRVVGDRDRRVAVVRRAAARRSTAATSTSWKPHLRDQIADLDAAGLAATKRSSSRSSAWAASTICPASSRASTAGGSGSSSCSAGDDDDEPRSDSRWTRSGCCSPSRRRRRSRSRASSPASPTKSRRGSLRNVSLPRRCRSSPATSCAGGGWPCGRRRSPAAAVRRRRRGRQRLSVTADRSTPSCSWPRTCPSLLWFIVAYPYMGGDLRSHERRMDFVRFTGEWCHLLRADRVRRRRAHGPDRAHPRAGRSRPAERVLEWMLPSGAAGAIIVAAWLVESKQRVVENMAPVLTMLFTPLFVVDAGRRRRRLRRRPGSAAPSTASCSASSTR